MEIYLFSEKSIRTTAFFTGHRHLPPGSIEHISEKLLDCISSAYAEGYRRFFCGCALGFDTLAALQTLRLKKQHPDLLLSLAIPCQNQSARWAEKDKKIYSFILDQADEKTVLSPDYYQGVMLTRKVFIFFVFFFFFCKMIAFCGEIVLKRFSFK